MQVPSKSSQLRYIEETVGATQRLCGRAVAWLDREQQNMLYEELIEYLERERDRNRELHEMGVASDVEHEAARQRGEAREVLPERQPLPRRRRQVVYR